MPDRPITRRVLLGHFAASGILFAQSSPAHPQQSRASIPSPTGTQLFDPLANLKTVHPRLILPDSDLPRVRALAHEHPLARKLLENLEREAEKLETSPVSDYKLVGPRLLATSRRVLDRIYTLALIYRLNGQTWCLERAVKELRAAAMFPNWNPQHFLDVAEMTHAFAIGYDWLFPALAVADRDWIRAAIVEKGLDPALAAYKDPTGWAASASSWNLVCNSGIALGVIALADDEPDRARAVLRNVFDSIPRGMATYAPDGGWPEGPANWNYATRYVTCLIGALETAFDNDHGVAASRGFDRTGRFRIYGLGPTNRTFNFGDSTDEAGSAPEMLWLARRFDQPVYAGQEEREADRLPHADALDLAWFYKDSRAPQGDDWPLSALFTGVQVAFLRSAWDDSAAIFLGVKGGDNKGNHTHLDLGSFVLDAGGVRWAYDPGPEDYNLPGYLGKQRYTYFKTRTEAHNTMLIDGENQDPKATAHISRHDFSPALSFVEIDLSHAYPAKVKQLQRRIGILQNQAVLVQDTLSADQPVEPLWGMMTDADIAVNGQTAELKKNDWTLSCEIRSPHHAVFDVVEAQNTRKLVARVGAKVTELDLSILLTPHRTGSAKPRVNAQFPV